MTDALAEFVKSSEDFDEKQMRGVAGRISGLRTARPHFDTRGDGCLLSSELYQPLMEIVPSRAL